MYDLIIRGALAYGLDGEGHGHVDVATEGGLIARVEPRIGAPAREELDADGMRLLPGGVDVHVHLRSPGHPEKEDWATGTRAAAAGGITTLLDMPNTVPPTTDGAALASKRALAEAAARVSFGLYMGATPDNLDEILRLEEHGAGPIAVKAYLGSSTGSLLLEDPFLLDRWLRNVQAHIAVHAEDEAMLRRAAAACPQEGGAILHGRRRPREAAVAAVGMAMGMALRRGHRLHICHLSTQEELALVHAAEPAHLISCEVTPHHLWLDEGDLHALGNLGKMNPPLRTAGDRDALWQALRDRRVTAIGTDHAPHTHAEKARPTLQAPSGVPGLDTSLRLLVRAVAEGRIDWETLVWAFSTGPATTFGLHGKGRVAPGADADLVLIKPGPDAPLRAEELFTRCGWSPFEGWPLPPAPHRVWVRGQLVAADGRIVDDSVRGGEVRGGAAPVLPTPAGAPA